MLDVVVRIQSSYYELTSSKYRLAITENTLIPSLRMQNWKRFKIVLELSPMDPCYTRRRRAFDQVGVSVELEEQAVLQKRLEIRIDDDDVVHPSFLEAMRLPKENLLNTRLLCPSGYLYDDGRLTICRGRPDQVSVVQYVEEENEEVKQSLVVTRSPCWIATRHGMNRTMLPKEPINEEEVVDLRWSCWKQNIVERYCKTTMIQATANGCELFPTRSRSVVFALGSARRIRK